MSQTVFKKGKAQVPKNWEYGHTSKPYFEAVEIVPVGTRRPAEEEVVHERKSEARSNTIFGHVNYGKRSVGEQNSQ